MKNFVKVVMILTGAMIVVGTAGSLEQETITIGCAVLRMLSGGVVAGIGWLFGEICEVVAVIKRTKRHRTRFNNIIEFRKIA